MMTDFKGDNTASFDNTYIEIDIENSTNYTISKAEFITGCLVKTFNNPVFPLYINFDEVETLKLNFKNVGYLVVYDEQRRRKQCDGNIVFTFKNGAICYE